MSYNPRIVDQLFLRKLESAGAVLIEGVKACGKTETALQQAASYVHCDSDDMIETQMQIDPRLVLQGDVPRLLDEWQEYTSLWNYVRREVDNRKKKGQFILTGSATPDDSSKRHSGVGRFSILRMRTMSTYERGWSSGEVSLKNLLKDGSPVSRVVELDLELLSEMLIYGGWPGLLNSTLDQAVDFGIDYVKLTSEVDISKVDNKKRDPFKVMKLIQSLARNIATEASIVTLAKDAGGSDGKLSNETVSEYLSVLERLMFIENIPAWNTHIRSSDTLRKSPKRQLADPSLAIAALHLSKSKLLADLKYLGLLFESMVIRDLQVYAEANNGKVYHYRDSRGLEVDAIIEYMDGTWSAFEIKLGLGAIEEAAYNLHVFKNKLDFTRVKEPSSINIITGKGFAHKRKDGINVIPWSVLKD